jgi:hypothetical protein
MMRVDSRFFRSLGEIPRAGIVLIRAQNKVT